MTAKTDHEAKQEEKAEQESTTCKELSLPEELVLALLNEESGYFYQVPGWNLNCAIAGAVLAELSFESRIDADLESLFVVDATKIGDPALDPALEQIAAETEPRNAQYWIERLASHADSIINLTLDRLVNMDILEHHNGDFWTLTHAARRSDILGVSREDNNALLIKTRIERAIFNNEIPGPRDVVVICLINTCDVFRSMFQLDEEAEERIELICQMDIIGRSIAGAVADNLAGSLFQRSALARKIPRVSLRKILLNRHVRIGNIPALFTSLAQEYGPVFELRPPFAKPMIFLAGLETNTWVNRRGRMYLRAKDYFADFEKIYGASGVLPSLDGAEHFRLRKALSAAYSRRRLQEQLDDLYSYIRGFMLDWSAGRVYSARQMCRRMINAQISPLMVGVESQDIIDDLVMYKERALRTHILRSLPKFMLKTPSMRRRSKGIQILIERVRSAHTSTQRGSMPRILAGDLLSLHVSDPQFVPESNLRFALSAALIASVYLGDAWSFVLYEVASQPELYSRIQSEADALFSNGDPKADDFKISAIDVTHRFLIECLRMHPIVPMSIRHVMNSFMIADYELQTGKKLFIAQTATHYMKDIFPDPFRFDIDRYKPPRDEHKGPGYAPYGLGTHTCLGFRWVEMQLAVNLLMTLHYFDIELSPANYKLRYSPLPSMKPSKKMKISIVKQRRELS